MTAMAVDAERVALARVPTDLLIGDGWSPAEGGRTLPVEDPAMELGGNAPFLVLEDANAAAPFGGVKASGVGREGGPEGIGAPRGSASTSRPGTRRCRSSETRR